MADYRAPLADIRFVLTHIAGLAELAEAEVFRHADPESVFGALEECGRFMSDVVAPLNRVGDTVGSQRQADGSVRTPPGFADAYRRYVDAGWGAVPFDPEFGGGGFPWVVAVATQEMMTSANMAFSLCPLLTQGAIDAITHHGTAEQQALYLPKMISGEWTGTMNLTEPQAGSDVGALTTKALPAGDGTWRITGQKIFITFGEHDMTEQIVHLVLARTPGAAPGTKGISCFIVPKFLINADGSLGARNDAGCVSIEHKLGIHGSPTCVMSYGDGGGAVGWMLGEEHSGMKTMFTMMNTARLSVGLEGVALAERAFQLALTYAQVRSQGRAIGAPSAESSAIIEHPDVRRMLMTMKANIEAMRCLAYLNAASIDRSKIGATPADRAAAKEFVDLLTPITKGWSTDLGVELTSIGVQIHGGMGYIEETGAAQFFRDARIAPIYEGTNGIQAIDLVLRKLPMRGGAVFAELIASMRGTAADCRGVESLATIGASLGAAADALEGSAGWLGATLAAGQIDDVLAGASPFLRMAGTVVGGWLLARSALAANGGGADPGFCAAKIATAAFYAGQILPTAAGLHAAVTAGAAPLFAIAPVQLASA